MKRRIVLLSLALSIVTILATAFLVLMATYNNTFNLVKREIQVSSRYISEGLKENGPGFLDNLTQNSEHRITLIASDGTVLFDNQADANTMENHLGRPEVKSALETGAGNAIRHSSTLEKDTYYYAKRQSDGSVLRLAVAIDNVWDSFSKVLPLIGLIALAVFAAAGLSASVLTKRIVAPINNINLERPEESKVYDELAPLVLRIKQQRRQIKQQLKSQEKAQAEFSLITKNMNEGFLIIDKNGNVLSYNNSAIKLLDSKVSQAKNISASLLNRSEKFRALLQNAFSGEKQEEIIKIAGRDCLITANPVIGDGTHGVVMMIIDITEKLEREKLRREFTANVSHELQTPLTAISGYAELIANGVAKQEDTAPFAERIYKESRRLMILIHDLMLLSKLDESALMPTESMNLLSLCETIKERLEDKADEKCVSIEVSGDNAVITGVPAVLDEMVFNLADNAIKYNRQGGSVNINISENDSNVLLSVSDNGPGISDSDKSRVFERFYRVDKSHNNAIPGTGLGLAIVKHGAIFHKSELSLDSNISGSKFVIKFPK